MQWIPGGLGDCCSCPGCGPEKASVTSRFLEETVQEPVLCAEPCLHSSFYALRSPRWKRWRSQSPADQDLQRSGFHTRCCQIATALLACCHPPPPSDPPSCHREEDSRVLVMRVLHLTDMEGDLHLHVFSRTSMDSIPSLLSNIITLLIYSTSTRSCCSPD